MSCNVTINVDCESDGVTGVGECPCDFQWYSETIGDGVSRNFDVTHNLNTNNVIVNVREVGTGLLHYDSPDRAILDLNTIRFEFAATPAPNDYVVTIVGLPPV